MKKAVIFGAGSIGNHLAHSCRSFGYKVSVYDINEEALVRFKTSIYPERYGFFDDEIALKFYSEITSLDLEDIDLMIIGTPPDTHLKILEYVVSFNPKVVLLEKPIVTPSSEEISRVDELIKENPQIVFLCGYNHRVATITKLAKDYLKSIAIGKEFELHVKWQESWSGIMLAHPWINSPSETYLGFSKRGGGASFEHSHGIDIWLYFHGLLGLPIPDSLMGTGDLIFENEEFQFDKEIELQLYSSGQSLGTIKQDVVTSPAKKSLRIECDDKVLLQLEFGFTPGKDSLQIFPARDSRGHETRIEIVKPRWNDFDLEIIEIDRILENHQSIGEINSALLASSSLKTAFIATAGLESARIGNSVKFDLIKYEIVT